MSKIRLSFSRFWLAAALLLGLAIGPQESRAADYIIDAGHSTVGFRIKHLAISNVDGKFVDFKGKFSFDPASIATSKAEASIAVKSIDTSQSKRDDHLRGADFFDVEKFSEITFKSVKTQPISEKEFKVLGDLTIRGVTKPVELTVSYEGSAKDPWGKEKAAFSATTKINRKDFGLTWNKVLETGGLVVGDEVKITLEIEGEKV